MLIDFHVHCFPDKLAAGAVGSLHKASGYPYYTNGTLADTREKLDAWGVDKAVLLNIAVSPRTQHSVNNFAIEANDGQRFFAFGSVHPDAPDALQELDRLKAAGIRGIKLHPAYQGFAADDRKVYPIYARCAELDLAVVFHAGWDIAFPDARCSEPEQCEKVIRDFPSCRFVLAHLGGMERWDEVERRLCGKDVYLDLAFVGEAMQADRLSHLLGLHDPKRLLFATDCPWSTPPRLSALLDEAGITGELRENINHRNAEALLRL